MRRECRGKLRKCRIHNPRNKQNPEDAEIIVLDTLVHEVGFHYVALALDKMFAGMVKMIL